MKDKAPRLPRFLLLALLISSALSCREASTLAAPSAPPAPLDLNGAWTGTFEFYDRVYSVYSCPSEEIRTELVHNQNGVIGHFKTRCFGDAFRIDFDGELNVVQGIEKTHMTGKLSVIDSSDEGVTGSFLVGHASSAEINVRSRETTNPTRIHLSL